MFKKKKILALVPARSGSKGIKNKNLKKINNISLIGHTSEFIDSLKIVDKKILSSDGNKILKEAKKYNFDTIKRPIKLSGDKISDFQVIEHALKKIDYKSNKFDILIYLQPTSPIRQISHLKNALNTLIKKNFQSAWSVTKINNKYNPLKVLKIESNYLKLFMPEGKKVIARQQLKEAYIRNGVFYIFSIKDLLKQKNIYLKKTFPSVTNYRIANIDNLKDLAIAKKLL